MVVLCTFNRAGVLAKLTFGVGGTVTDGMSIVECPGISQFNASRARIPLRRNQFLKIHHVFLSLKFLMKFSEIHSLNFHLEDSGGAKWKLNFFPTL